LILLNSQKPHAVEGYLARTELDFLEDCLKKYPEHHAIVVFHHQPIPVGASWLDKLGLQNADELWTILAQHPNSHTIIFGHIHQEFQAERNGIHCYGTPSTCIQFKRNSADFALEKLAPAYRWVDLYPDGTLKTGICRTAHYVGVFDSEAKGY
jgi:Icc protein